MTSFSESVFYYAEHPYNFVLDIVKAKPTYQQKIVLLKIPGSIRNKKGIAVKSGHGVGKTAMESWIILWFLSCFPYSKVICTAPTQHQLYDIVWSELAKWHKVSSVENMYEWRKTHFFNKRYPENWFAVARTSNKPENMQGFHGEHLLFLVEEASGVSTDVLEVIEGTQTQEGSLIIMFGNPTQISGGFYDAFNTKRPFYNVYTLNSELSPLVDKIYCKTIAAKYGKESDIYRVRVLGEFPKAEPDTLIPLDRCEAAAIRELDDKYPDSYNDVEIGVDVARYGDDESDIYVRIKNKIEHAGAFRKRDLMTVTGEIVKVYRKYENKNVMINIDDSGLGGGVTDRLKELAAQGVINADIFGVNNGSKAKDSKFLNVGTEMWFFTREKIQDLKIPNDNDLIAQLSCRKYGINSSGRHVLESKEHMKERGISSPDRADAFILSLRSLVYGNSNEKARSFAC